MENEEYIVAIDLGTNTVATVLGARSSTGDVRIVDGEVVAVQGMVRSEIKNIELVAQSIKQCLDAIQTRQSVQIQDAYTGVSGQHIRSVKYPYYVFVGRDGEIREEDVRKLHESMSNVQAPDGEVILQIIPQSYLVDQEETSNPVGAFGNKLEATFNFILGDSNATSRIKRALSRVEVRQRGLYLNAIAVAEAVATQDEQQEGVVVIDLGGGTTDVTVIHNNIIRHVAIIPMGGNSINKDIRSYGILERHVENLKVKYGYAMRERVTADKLITTPGLNARVSKEISSVNLAAIIEARMLDIVDLVMDQVKASGYADRLAAGIIITGGGAQLKELDALIKSHTGLEVRMGTPEHRVSTDSHEIASNPAMATAIGLLLRGAQSKATHTGENSKGIPAPSPAGAKNNTTESPYTKNPYAVNTPAGTRTINEQYPNGINPDMENNSTEEGEQTPKKKNGLLGSVRGWIDSMFDGIDDNEI